MKLQKARKDHECALCGGKISKGDKHWVEYFQDLNQSRREHINCLLHENQHKIHEGIR